MRCMITTIAVLAIAGLIGASDCQAHNGGVLLQLRNGQIDVGADSEQTGMPPNFETNVFTSLLNSVTYAQDLPSYLSLSNPPEGTEALPKGTDIYWDFLPMTINGATSNLWYWDGQGTSIDSVQFEQVPQAGVTMSLYNIDDSQSATVTGTAELVPGALLGTTSTTDDRLRLHYHNYYLLDDGDGVLPTTVPEGAYLIAMRLRMAGATPSDPFFVLASTFPLASNSLESVEAAYAWVDANQHELILPGDYNYDGQVDLDDYAVWKEQFGSDLTNFAGGNLADGNSDGQVDLADYTVWRDHLMDPAVAPTMAAVPEPSTKPLLLMCLLIAGVLSGKRARHPAKPVGILKD
ncbi:hypothetical protein [Aeoliella mucimassa]|uniref:Dockerin domain-containing protein n=1 Tax=Aeoliella mucimassa TaxID=2527972 RepID=A0A518AGH4_9BACT|nr:hypothetical protein [Aeoliella mucimassa]QDU53830.1 hypothetical protein Pan181_00080 [Aeoliella mucimassa]